MNSKWIKRPFDPAKWPFFYGWVIVAAAIVATLASIPGQTMGIGVFTDYLIDVLKISRNELSTAYMVGTIASSLILPKAGAVLDRIGARAMIVWSSIFLGVSMVFFAHIGSVITFFSIGNSVFTLGLVSIAFLLIRFFGQGCLTMTARVTIGKWFNHKRGLASAISGVFIALGFNASPAFLNQLIDWFNWQSASLILACMLGVLVSVFSWIFFRDNPEQCGLTMDGEDAVPKDEEQQNTLFDVVKEFTRAEALRTFPFWIFSLAAGTVAMVMTALTFHAASLGREMGLGRDEVYSLFIPMSLFSIGANFLASWVSDRIRHKWLLAAMMTAQIIGLVGLIFLWSEVGQFAFFVGQGTAIGIFIAAATVLLPRFYGREHLGAISGFNFSVMVFASAIGPVLFSSFQNITGSYKEVLLGTTIIPLVLLLFSFYVINPQQKVNAQI